MKRALPVFRGDVTAEGRLVLCPGEQADRRAHLLGLAGTRVDLTIAVHKDTRSQRANDYYWKCVVRLMAQSTGHTEDEIHDAMCEQFLPNERTRVEFFNRLTGECLTVDTDSRRTSRLTGTPFYDYVETVRQWAREFLSIETQDPDPEYWRKKAA